MPLRDTADCASNKEIAMVVTFVAVDSDFLADFSAGSFQKMQEGLGDEGVIGKPLIDWDSGLV